MKNIPAKQNTSTSTSASTAAFAVPLSTFQGETTDVSAKAGSEISRHMLLIRLSEAASRIREEAQLIRSVGFTDPSARLLRILGETNEEQQLALANKGK